MSSKRVSRPRNESTSGGDDTDSHISGTRCSCGDLALSGALLGDGRQGAAGGGEPVLDRTCENVMGTGGPP